MAREWLETWDLEDLLAEAGYPYDSEDLAEEIERGASDEEIEQWLRDAGKFPPLPPLCGGVTDPKRERELYLSSLPPDVAARVKRGGP